MSQVFANALRLTPLIALCLIQAVPIPTWALPRTWIGGNVDWVDGGANTNWNPNDEPDSDDEAIFSTANAVNLGSNNAVNGLTLSGGIDLFTNEFDLTVDGLVQAIDASTTLFINGSSGSINADDVTINASGTIELSGGLLTLDEEVGTSLIDINVGGNLIGNGTISFADAPGVVTTVLVNDGELTALSRGLTIFTPPPVGTLQIDIVNSNARVDLDGAGEAGVVNVNRNQTLDLNAPFADDFNGTMNLFQESTFNSLNAWTLAGGSILVNNGFIDNPIPNPDVPAGTAVIDGGLLTQTGGTINVVDTDGTLHMDVNFTMSGGTFTNSGTVIFDGTTTTITTAAGYAPAVSSAETIINGTMTITDAAGDFNWDGPGTATTTINGTGSLSLTVDQVDTGNDTYGGVLNLNDNADLAVNNTANSWTLANTLNKNNVGTSTVSGDRVVITGDINANVGTLDMPAVTTTGSTTLAVASTLTLGGATEFGGATSIAGAGTLFMEGTSTVTANTTIGVATFDWDGLGTGTTHTINDGVTFTINSTTIDSDNDMDDPINLGGNGTQLIVNGGSPWTATAAINANNAGAGTATIGGSRRLILFGSSADFNVNGNTNISAPLTFGASSSASIDAGFTLNATNTVTYDGASISGLGTYSPGTTNLVTADTSITSSIFDFDNGSWTVEPDDALTVNVTDYDTTATNAFDGTITLNDGAISVTTGDAEFVMDGVLNMVCNNVNLAIAEWNGEPLDIGNDSGALDADVNVSGTFFSRINSPVDFNSDADINVDGVAFLLNSTVNFDTVNGVNNAEFTGDGFIRFGGVVNVNEAVTLNMIGGEVDLDGPDTVGDFVNIDAPMTINAAAMSSFGRVNGGGGVNTLDINNSVGLGVLTVNLDNPADEWTLNGPGVMNLVNDNTAATLLAGSDVNINGTLNVTGDVRVTARVDLSGTVNINTAAQPLRLSGGDAIDVNTINGATINGPGLLSAHTDKALHGFGTINSDIDFDGTSILRADNGTLTIAGTILQVNTIGTDDDDGILNVVNAWNSNVASFVNLVGGELKGGTITVNNTSGITGIGLVSARIINNTRLLSNGGGTLLFETAANDNDWDGTGNTGELRAGVGMTLELRDVGAAFGFGGTVSAVADGTVFANGFALDFNPGSTLSLQDGASYRSTSSTDIGGTVTVNAGTDSTIEVEFNRFLVFEPTSTTTLNGNLRLENNNIIIEAGATFSGAGALIIPQFSHVILEPNADVNVLFINDGSLRPNGIDTVGVVDVADYQQGVTGTLVAELTGTALNQYDRLVVNGTAVLDGSVEVQLDGGFAPVLGNTFNILSTSGGLTGAVAIEQPNNLPVGLFFNARFEPTILQLVVTDSLPGDYNRDSIVDAADYLVWRKTFGAVVADFASADGNGDGFINDDDYGVWRRHFGTVPPPGSGSGNFTDTQVPEPSSSIVVLIALTALALRRRIS